MDANDQTAANTAAAEEAAETAQLESQEDLAYVTGQHGAAEAEKQVRNPGARRQRVKGKDDKDSQGDEQQ